MAASPPQSRAPTTADGSPVPVARRAGRPRSVAAPVEPEPPIEWDWWTPEAMKGWAGSVSLHALLLLILAFWYFSPPLHKMVTFDSRLAGSPNGVSEGEMLAGGLNTPLSMPVAALTDNELAADTPTGQLTLAPLAPEREVSGRQEPQRRGRQANDNPGAGDGDGFGLARFGDGGELIRGVAVKVGDPQFTLIWNTDGVDLDLHVIEPGGKEIYWEEPKGQRGRRARRRQYQGIRSRKYLLDGRVAGAGIRKGQGARPRRNLQVVCRLLGRFRRDRQADPLAGPRQARRQGQRLSRQVQPPQRAEQDVYAQASSRLPVPRWSLMAHPESFTAARTSRLTNVLLV